MGEVTIEDIVVFGWALALLLGCVMAVRAQRGWATFIMVIGAGVSALSIVALGIVEYMMTRALLAKMLPVAPGDPLALEVFDSERYQALMSLSSGALLLGLVLFVTGFIGFSARYGTEVRRRAELEAMVRALQERLEESERSS